MTGMFGQFRVEESPQETNFTFPFVGSRLCGPAFRQIQLSPQPCPQPANCVDRSKKQRFSPHFPYSGHDNLLVDTIFLNRHHAPWRGCCAVVQPVIRRS